MLKPVESEKSRLHSIVRIQLTPLLNTLRKAFLCQQTAFGLQQQSQLLPESPACRQALQILNLLDSTIT